MIIPVLALLLAAVLVYATRKAAVLQTRSDSQYVALAQSAAAKHGRLNVGDLVILKSARIFGDVHYDTLTIEQGAQVDGRFAHREPGALPLAVDDGGEPRLTLAG